jgi:hypothetical protein
MSHKEEAKRVIGLPMGGDTVMEAEIYALTHAVLALVEAQEAANEQARIANLLAVMSHDPREYDTWLEIARTLGIEVAE